MQLLALLTLIKCPFFTIYIVRHLLVMSWLKNICEGILNEISPDEAYPKYYSNMSREDFDRVLGGERNVDKFYRFFLDCIRDNGESVDSAVFAIRLYNESNDVVRQRVLNKLRTGEYETIEEFRTDLEYFNGGGTVVSRKQFAKEGYHSLYRNERWAVTCTTNYAANNKFFGNSHWCTASDREGRYDGYGMFRRYSINDSSVLVQFMWRGQVAEKNNEDITNEDLANGIKPITPKFDDEEGYVAEIIEPRYRGFQVQIRVDGTTRQICDFYDNGMDEEDAKRYIGTKFFDAIKDPEGLQKMLNIQSEQNEKEYKYEASREHIVQARKQRRLEQRRRIKEQYSEQAREFNKQQEKKVVAAWNEFMEQKLYENPEVIDRIRKIKEEGAFTLEEIESVNYAHVWDSRIGKGGVQILDIGPIMGIKAIVKELSDTRPLFEVVKRLTTDCTEEFQGGLIVMMQPNGASVDIVDSLSVDNYCGPYSVDEYFEHETGDDEEDSRSRFFSVYDNDERISYVFDTVKKGIFTVREECGDNCAQLGGEKFIFYDDDRGDYDMWFLYDANTGEVKDYTNSDLTFRTKNSGVFIGNGNRQRLYKIKQWADDFEVNGLDIPCGDSIYSWYTYNHEESGRRVFIFSFRTKEGEYRDNMLFEGDSDFVFGVFGDGGGSFAGPYELRDDGVWVDVLEMRIWPIANRRFTKRIFYLISKNEFVMRNDETGEFERCDRFGRTEKYQRADRYLKDFQNRGGYSPEVQAQMDKMWQDKEGGQALDAWDDNDVGTDYTVKKTADKYSDDDFFREIQRFEPTDKPWSGYVMRKDPEGFKKGFDNWWGGSEELKNAIGKNPWYRVDNHGRAIDQPWNDEDEIPANLSDRVVRENRIPSKLISLWDKLGLND